MREMLTRLYLKIYALFTEIICFIRLVKLALFLHSNHLIRNGVPKDILRVIGKYVELAHYNYPSSTKMNRTVGESSALLSTLIYVYMETGSRTLLNQILEVLVTEIIERDQKHGSK